MLPTPHLLTCPPRAASLAATLARWDATDWGRRFGRPRIHVDDPPEAPDEPWGDPRRGLRIVRAFARCLAAAVGAAELAAEAPGTQRGSGAIHPGARPGESDPPAPRPPRPRGEPPASDADAWLLLLEDDLDFHPRLAASVASWAALDGAVMATLFNPGLSEERRKAEGPGRTACGDAAGGASSRPPPTLPSAFTRPPRIRCFPADFATFLGAQALLLRRSFARRALAAWDSVTGMQSQRLAQLHRRFHPGRPILVHRPSLVQHVPVDGGSGWGARVQRALDFDPAWSPDRA